MLKTIPFSSKNKNKNKKIKKINKNNKSNICIVLA